MISQPQPDEYAPFYANYVNLAVQSGDILHTFNQLKDSTCQFLTGLPDEKGNYAYAEGKWTIKQLLSHLIDAERFLLFGYSAFRGTIQMHCLALMKILMWIMLI